MSTFMEGRLVDENGLPLVNFRVTLNLPPALIPGGELASDFVQGNGFFTFKHYRKGPAERMLELAAYDPIGRPLPFAPVGRASKRFPVQEEHLFDLDPDRLADLEARQLTAAFNRQFTDHDQPLNLQEAELGVDVLHEHWTITTRTRIYTIRKTTDQKLQVFRLTGRVIFKDVADEQITGEEFVVRAADAQGLLVTLDTGRVSGFSSGNGITWLMDQDAFSYAATLLKTAREYVLFSQLYFDLPAVFNADATKETPSLIFDFSQPLDADHLRAAGAVDARPERLLLQAADGGATVRFLLHSYQIPLLIKILVGVLVFPFAGSDGISSAIGGLQNLVADIDAVKRYFADSGRSNIKVQPFKQPLLSGGVMHNKLMVVDSRRALSLGSPFGQSYIDTHDHRIDAPVRGDETGFPKHDASFVVAGPAMGEIYNTLALLWNTMVPDDRVQSFPPDRPDNVHGPEDPLPDLESVAGVQIVRTLSVKTFKDPPEGEKGILESYLRAIANAKDFIYLENQYFTDDIVGDALAQAIVNSPKLQVIMVINIRPDMPFYPFKQRRLIHRIREGIADAPNGKLRFGVYTRWTHEVGTPRPRILPIYVHAKLGIVDNLWATVGSANLDGLSLDSCLVGDAINATFRFFDVRQLVRDERAIELNAVALNTEENSSDAVDLLRRKLWAEHLGFSLPTGAPNINAPELTNRPADGWLSLWKQRSDATLLQLTNKPALPQTGMARVLPWPFDNTTHKTPRDHLNALGVHTYAVVPLKSTRAFDFKTGKWKEGSKAEMDYD